MIDRVRRTLVNWWLVLSGSALVAAIAYPVVRFLVPPEIPEAATAEVDAGFPNDPEFREKQFKIVRFGADPVIVVRVSETDFRAFSAVCTHLSCIVDFRMDKQLIWCWCHNGIYDLHGKNIGGPPPRPLAPYVARLVESGGQQKVIVRKS